MIIWLALIVILLGMGIFLYVEDKWIVKTTHVIESEKLNCIGDKEVKIAHVSDLQSCQFGKGQKSLGNILDKINPDIIMFTGDLIDRNHTDVEKSLEAVRIMTSKAPVFFVDGNHELMAPQEEVDKMYGEMGNLGVNFVMDKAIELCLGDYQRQCRIKLLGLGEETILKSKEAGGRRETRWNRELVENKVNELVKKEVQKNFFINFAKKGIKVPRERRSFPIELYDYAEVDKSYIKNSSSKAGSIANPKSGSIANSIASYKEDSNSTVNFTILLAHEPQMFEAYQNEEVDLVLAGHAHGGQIRLPFVSGFFAPNQGWFPKYTSGLYEGEHTKMLVSRGLGNSTFPFRIFNRPEVIEVVLKGRD